MNHNGWEWHWQSPLCFYLFITLSEFHEDWGYTMLLPFVLQTDLRKRESPPEQSTVSLSVLPDAAEVSHDSNSIHFIICLWPIPFLSPVITWRLLSRYTIQAHWCQWSTHSLACCNVWLMHIWSWQEHHISMKKVYITLVKCKHKKTSDSVKGLTGGIFK